MENNQHYVEQTNDYKQIILDFVEGRMEMKEFQAIWEGEEHEAILDWLQSRIPEGKTCQEQIKVKPDYFLQNLPAEEYQQIIEARQALLDAQDSPLEEQLSFAKTLVDLLMNADSKHMFGNNSLITALLYSYNMVLSNPSAYKESYVAEEPNRVRNLFDTQYVARREIPYDVRIVLRGLRSPSVLGYYLNVQGWLYRLMKEIYPAEAIIEDETLGQKYSFKLDVCPDCVDSAEVSASGIIDAIIAEFPETLPKTQRKKQIRQRIKEVFYLTETKSPRWVQASEWPISPSGKPMRFVKQVKAKGKLYEECMYTSYIFEDVDTGETKTIDQFT